MPSERLSDEELDRIISHYRELIADWSWRVLCALTELRELRAYQRIERLERITDRIAYEDDKDADHGK